MRRVLLCFYCLLTSYRFPNSGNWLKAYCPTLETGAKTSDTEANKSNIEAIRTKAGASLTSVSALLGFVVAVIAWLATLKLDVLYRFLHSERARHQILGYAAWALGLPYLSFWLQRYISAVSGETKDHDKQRKKRRLGSPCLFLFLSLAASVFLFLGAPAIWPSGAFRPGFVLAGVIMTACSVVLLLFALQFYDSAAGLSDDVGLHSHIASIASNSYLLGVSFALTGASLCVCFSEHFLTGRWLAASALVVLVTMTEIERALRI